MFHVLITPIVNNELGRTSRHDFDDAAGADDFANNHEGLDCIAVVKRDDKIIRIV